MFIYAELDETGTVIGISFLSGEIDAPNMILLAIQPSVDESIEWFFDNGEKIDLRWRFIDGEWHEPLPPIEPEEPAILPVSNEEVIQAIMYLTAIEDVKEAQSQLQSSPMRTFGANSPRYDFWKFAYYNRHTNDFTFETRLVPGGVLTQDEADRIISEGQRTI